MSKLDSDIDELLVRIEVFVARIRLLRIRQNEISGRNESESLNILEDELIQTEIELYNSEKKYKELSQLRDWQDSCEHVFVEDLVDIDPDRSKIVKYCEHCLFTTECG